MDTFSEDTFIISQEKEMLEIFTGFETKNKYSIKDTDGRTLLLAAEEAGSGFAQFVRIFLKALRPFTMHIQTLNGESLLRLERPFRFMFHEVNVYDGNNKHLGKIQKRFSLLRKIYTVFDASGMEEFELFGPIFRPWTFNIKRDGEEIGKITKKWSGFLKEAFTDADNFGITFTREIETSKKILLLAAVFLIDFVHFENTNNNN